MRKYIRMLAQTISFVCTDFSSAEALAGPINEVFKASFNVQEVLLSGPSVTCSLAGMTIGRGSATHLGMIMLTATDCVHPFPTYFNFNNGKFTLTATNGDTVTAIYGGSLTPTQDGALYTLNGWFQIIGGTGHFAGARGTGQLSGSEKLENNAPPVPPSASGKLEAIGIISY
ncbi:hypothetical protein AAKU55_002781 [Oxalobacteraceae bacterium GrIS 1.11]